MENYMKIGEKIKSLRKKHDMTQEDLANYLGVSFQAISKWECGIASPDISLFVPLSRLFGVTIDELFDNSPQKTDARREELERLIRETYRSGDLEMRCDLLQSAVSEYPGDMRFLIRLSDAEYCRSLDTDHDPDRKKELLESSVKHAQIVIEKGDDETGKTACRDIVSPLLDLNRREEALKYAELSGDEDAVIRCLRGEDKTVRLQKRIMEYFGGFISRLNDRRDNIDVLDMVIGIMKTVFPDENYLFYADEIMIAEIWRAEYYSKHGMYEEAITSLKQAYKYAVYYDDINAHGEPVKYTTPIFDRLAFDPKTMVTRCGTGGYSDNFAEFLDSRSFDDMRDTEEFKALYDF